MFLLRSRIMQATALDQDAADDAHRMVIRRGLEDGTPELVDMRWGLEPREPGHRPRRFIRSEGKQFSSHRCLVPASEFHVKQGSRRFRFRLEDGNFFYLAGIWRPDTPRWPDACAILTIDANPDVARYQERQGVVIRRNRHLHWLDQTLSDEELLQPLPVRSFLVEEITGSAAQRLLPI